MPYKKGSCLNEEYTEIVTQIHSLLKEAEEKYKSLPPSLKECGSNLGYHKESLGWYLTNGESAAFLFAKGFGIDVEK